MLAKDYRDPRLAHGCRVLKACKVAEIQRLPKGCKHPKACKKLQRSKGLHKVAEI